MQKIESRQNPRIKNLVKLRERSQRNKTGHFMVEGLRELTRARDSRFKIKEFYFCSELFKDDASNTLRSLLPEEVEQIEVAKSVFPKISYRESPDGLIGVFEQSTLSLDELPLTQCPLLLISESIEKPGNLGALMRSADSAGADALICCDLATDPFNPNVIRASQGAFFSLPFTIATSAATRTFLSENKITPLAATPHTDTLFWDVDMTNPCALLVGSENEGLSNYWMESEIKRMKIPQAGISDSLNVSAAATLTLYEAARQRR